MPRIPQVGLQSPQVVPFQAPGTVPVQGSAGRQAAQLGGAIQQLGHRVQDELDHSKVQEADSLLSDAIRKGLTDPETGYRTLAGKHAVDGRQAALDALNEQRRKIGSGLTPDQQRLFQRAADARMQAATQAIDTHYSASLQAYQQGSKKAAVDAGIQDAIEAASAYGPQSEEFQVAAGKVKRDIDLLSDMLGISPEQAAGLRQEATTQIHEANVAKMLDAGQVKAARAYMAKYRDEMTAAGTKASATGLHTATIKDESTRLALELMKPPPLSPERAIATKGMSDAQILQYDEGQRLIQVQASLEELDNRFLSDSISAELRDATRDRIIKEESRRRTEIGESGQQALNAAELFLRNNKFASIDDVPSADLTRVKALGLLDTLKTFAENGRYDTNPQALIALMAMDPENLAAIPDGEFYVQTRRVLSDSDMKLLQARRKAVATERKATEKDLRLVSTAENTLVLAAKLGIDPQDKVAFDFFRRRVEDRLLLEADGKPLTVEQERKVFDAMAMEKADVPGSIYGYNQEPVYGMSKERLRDAGTLLPGGFVRLSAVNDDVKATIQAALRRQGITPTDEEVMRVWHDAGRPATVDELHSGATRWEQEQRKQADALEAPYSIPPTWEIWGQIISKKGRK